MGLFAVLCYLLVLIFIWPYCCNKYIKSELIDSGAILRLIVINLLQTDAVSSKVILLICLSLGNKLKFIAKNDIILFTYSLL